LTFIGSLLPGRVNGRHRGRQCVSFVAWPVDFARRELATRNAIEHAVDGYLSARHRSSSIRKAIRFGVVSFEFREDAKMTIVFPSRRSACRALDPADTQR
jgi:hypothetical protein